MRIKTRFRINIFDLFVGKLDFSEFTIMMREKLQGEDMEEEIRQAFR